MLETSLTSGLSSAEAEARLKRYGRNKLEQWPQSECLRTQAGEGDCGIALIKRLLAIRHTWKLLKMLVSSPLNQLLLLAAIIEILALNDFLSSTIILATILLLCLIVQVQKWRSESSVSNDLLKFMRTSRSANLTKSCLVMRDGQEHQVAPDILVPGDLVLLDPSEHCDIHADLRLVEVRNDDCDDYASCGDENNDEKKGDGHNATATSKLKLPLNSERSTPVFAIDESSLTGENCAQAKNIDAIQNELTQMLQGGGSAGASYYSIGANNTGTQDNAESGAESTGSVANFKDSLHQNIALAGTRVLFGRARGLVIATGASSRQGQVFGMLRASNVKQQELDDDNNNNNNSSEHLVASIERYSISSLVLAMLFVAACSIGYIIAGLSGTRVAQIACSLCVVAAPDGLRANLELVRSCAIARLSKRRLISKASNSLASLDKLGRLNVVLLASCNQQCLNDRDKRLTMADSASKLRDQFNIDIKLISSESRSSALDQARALGLISGAPSSVAEPLSAYYYHTIGSPTSVGGGIFSSSLGLAKNGRANSEAWNFGEDQSELDQDDETRLIMSGAQLQRLLNSDLDQLVKAREINSRRVFFALDAQQKACIVSKLQQDLTRKQLVCVVGENVNDIASMQRADLSIAAPSGNKAASSSACTEVADLLALETASEDDDGDDDAIVAQPVLLEQLLDAIVEGRGMYAKLRAFVAHQASLSIALMILVFFEAVALNSTKVPISPLQMMLINVLADCLPAQALAFEHLSEHETSSKPRSGALLNCWLAGTILMKTINLLALNWGLYAFMLANSDDNDSEQIDWQRLQAIMLSSLIFCSVFCALSLRSRTKTVFETRPNGNWPLMGCCAALVGTPFVLNWLIMPGAIEQRELLYVLLVASLVLLLADTAKLTYRAVKRVRKLMHKAAKKLHNTSSSSPDISAALGHNRCGFKQGEFGNAHLEALGRGAHFKPPLPRVVAPSPATMFQSSVASSFASSSASSSSPLSSSSGISSLKSNSDDMKAKLSRNF